MTAEPAYSGRDFADMDDEAIVRDFTAARPSSSAWPSPDMTLLNANRRAAVPMPTDLFGPALPLLQAIAAGTSTPLDYPAAGYIATCASLIGGKGPLTVPFNGVSVLGGIQPAKLADCLLGSPDDGLVARFLWTWPDKLPFSRPTRCAEMGLLDNAYRRLEGLEWGCDADGQPVHITLPLSRAAADLFEAWQADNASIDDEASGLLKSFVGKLDGVLLRLAVTAELLSGWTVMPSPWPSASMGMPPCPCRSAMRRCWRATSSRLACGS
jgi:hypothetical protein